MALILKNVGKTFEDIPLFSKLNMTFPDCGAVVLWGESGKGKTTLLRMICGLEPCPEGQITGGGMESCSMAFQEYRLFPTLNALENVYLTACPDTKSTLKAQAEALLSELGFDKQQMALYPSALSGGMKQRVSLCRAFLKKSPILLLDEPTKELDLQLRQRVYSLICAQAKERLVILTAHAPLTEELPEAIRLHL